MRFRVEIASGNKCTGALKVFFFMLHFRTISKGLLNGGNSSKQGLVLF